MNPARRREMVDREHPSLPIVRQCRPGGGEPLQPLLLSPGGFEEDLSLMGRWTGSTWRPPFYGSRRMKACWSGRVY